MVLAHGVFMDRQRDGGTGGWVGGRVGGQYKFFILTHMYIHLIWVWKIYIFYNHKIVYKLSLKTERLPLKLSILLAFPDVHWTLAISRALWRITLLPVTHVLFGGHMDVNIEMCMMTWNALQTHMWHHFWLFNFFTHPPPIHPYFYLSIFVFTCPNDRWTGLYIKLWL